MSEQPILTSSHGDASLGEHYLAAIDLGSRNCRLMVSKFDGKTLESVEVLSKYVCLADGVASTQKLSKRAMDRGVSVLKFCKKKLDQFEPLKLCCVTTDAMRRASNADTFLKRVKRETGIDLQIISAQEEARYAALGCVGLLRPLVRDFIVFDIGGGSSEIILGRVSEAGDSFEIIDTLSMPHGVVNIFEANPTMTFEGYSKVVREVKRTCRTFLSRYLKQEGYSEKYFQIIGTSGTTTTVAALNMNLKFYDRSRINGASLTLKELLSVVHYVQSMSTEERLVHACIGQAKDDLILGGLAIFEGILKAAPVKTVTVTDSGVRDGIIRTLAYGDQVNRFKV